MIQDIEKEILRVASSTDRFLNCVDFSIVLNCSAHVIEKVCYAMVERGLLMEKKANGLYEYKITAYGRTNI